MGGGGPMGGWHENHIVIFKMCLNTVMFMI